MRFPLPLLSFKSLFKFKHLIRPSHFNDLLDCHQKQWPTSKRGDLSYFEISANARTHTRTRAHTQAYTQFTLLRNLLSTNEHRFLNVFITHSSFSRHRLLPALNRLKVLKNNNNNNNKDILIKRNTKAKRFSYSWHFKCAFCVPWLAKGFDCRLCHVREKNFLSFE